MTRGDVLFVHNNFPAQFRFLAEALRDAGFRCAAIGTTTARAIDGISLFRWKHERGTTPGILTEATRAEADLIRGRAAAAAARRLKASGFNPRLIIGHPGWGETLYLREIFPEARQILYGEYYFRSTGGDTGFDPEFADAADQPMQAHAKNAGLMLAYSEADRIVAPTPYQKARLPEIVWDRTVVIHEGVDTALTRKRPEAVVKLARGATLDASVPVITFVNRVFEPLRGFHTFVRALPRVLKEVPEAHVVLVGESKGRGYGRSPPKGSTWRAHFMREVGPKLDIARLHFVGRVSYPTLLDVLSVSAAHVYYTYPFVLSWSLLEAMACECLIVASDTPPLRDVIDGRNGMLLPFFDPAALAEKLILACREPERFLPMRRAARETVLRDYDRARVSLPAWLALVEETLASGPRATHS